MRGSPYAAVVSHIATRVMVHSNAMRCAFIVMAVLALATPTRASGAGGGWQLVVLGIARQVFQI